MIRDAEHLIDKIKDLKDEMRLAGMTSIKLNYGSTGKTRIIINDAAVYSELRKKYTPTRKQACPDTFQIDGWLVIVFEGRIEEEGETI